MRCLSVPRVGAPPRPYGWVLYSVSQNPPLKGVLCIKILTERVKTAILFIKTPNPGGFVQMNIMDHTVRTLSLREIRVVLALAEQKRREVGRAEIIDLLGVKAKAADKVIESLRRKGWLERASWGEYLVIPPDEGPDALGESNLFALASRIADPYYIGYGSAAAHYGLTTQHRRAVVLVTPAHLRGRRVGEGRVTIVNPKPHKFFGFGPVDVLGFKVMMSDRETQY